MLRRGKKTLKNIEKKAMAPRKRKRSIGDSVPKSSLHIQHKALCEARSRDRRWIDEFTRDCLLRENQSFENDLSTTIKYKSLLDPFRALMKQESATTPPDYTTHQEREEVEKGSDDCPLIADMEIAELETKIAALGPSQRHAFEKVVNREDCVFITGGAGVGKSHLLRLIKNAARYRCRSVGVAAPTGIAGTNVKGSTLHSFFAMGPKQSFEDHKRKAFANKRLGKQLRTFDVLIVDEISMVDGPHLDHYSEICCLIRNCPAPFGGLQMVLCGDPLQLPPPTGARMAFESRVWTQLFEQGGGESNCCELIEVYRQTDLQFINILNRIRFGMLNDADLEILQTRLSKHPASALTDLDELKDKFCVRLYPLRKQVQTHNAMMERILNKACSPSFTYIPSLSDVDLWDPKQLERHARDLAWFRRQKDSMDYNSRVRIANKLRWFEWSKDEAFRKWQHINHCEGILNQSLRLHIGSRVMLTKNWKTSEGLVHGRTGWVTATEKDGPMVWFDETPGPIPVPMTGETIDCDEGHFRLEHLPLALCWAMTIHKAQGLSLSLVELYLDKIFSAGQGYVALSRATRLSGVRLLALDPKSIFPNEKVLKFYVDTFPQSPHVLAWQAHRRKICGRDATKNFATPTMAFLDGLPLYDESERTNEKDDKKERETKDEKQEELGSTACSEKNLLMRTLAERSVPPSEDELVQMFGKRWIAFWLLKAKAAGSNDQQVNGVSLVNLSAKVCKEMQTLEELVNRRSKRAKY